MIPPIDINIRVALDLSPALERFLNSLAAQICAALPSRAEEPSPGMTREAPAAEPQRRPKAVVGTGAAATRTPSAAPVLAEPATPARKMRPNSPWTPARVALMRADYPTADNVDLLAAIAALPGNPVTAKALHMYAVNNSLRKLPETTRKQRQALWQAAHVAAVTPPPVAAPPAVAPPPAVALPPPGPDGKIEVSFQAAKQLAAGLGLDFDGTQVALINKLRRPAPPIVLRA